MKSRKGLFVGLAVFLLTLVVTVVGGVALATRKGIEIKNGQTRVTEAQSEDLFISNGVVSVEADVDGDLVAAGGTVTVDGNVSDNLFIAGGTVTINGEIGGDVIIAGGQVELKGDVLGDLMVFGGTVTVTGDLWDDCRIFAGTVTVDSQIVDNFVVRAQEINISDDTSVGGEEDVVRVEMEDSEEVVADGAAESKITARGVGQWAIRTVLAILGWMAVGLVILKVAPVKTMNLFKSGESWKEALISLGVGFLAIPAAFILSIILLISRVGAPLAWLMLVVGAMVAYMGWIFPAGGMVVAMQKGKKNYLNAMLIGVGVAVLVCRIPWGVGLAIKAIFMMWGIGAVLVAKFKMLSVSKKG